jgi:hypothetical protein
MDYSVVLIDTLGKTIRKAPVSGAHDVKAIGRFYFMQYSGWSFWDPQTNAVVYNEFSNVDFNFGCRYGLFRVCLNDYTLSYINQSGKVVWKEKFDPKTVVEPNRAPVDFVQRRGLKPTAGYIDCSIGYERIYCAEETLGKSPLTFAFSPQVNSLTMGKQDTGKTPSVKLFLINATKDTCYDMNFCELTLYAKNPDGIWKTIQSGPRVKCGSGSSSLLLAPGHYMAYEVPVFNGVFKTEMKAYTTLTCKSKGVQVVSNSIPVKLNPGQLWREEAYDMYGVIKPLNPNDILAY